MWCDMPTKESIQIKVEWMARHHMEEVAEIERDAFIDPWLPEVIVYSIRRKETSGIVAIVNQAVAGYAIYSLVTEDYEPVLRVDRLAVAEWCRGCGVGGVLLDDLLGKLKPGRPRLVFPVRESNLIAQVWLREYELRCEEIREGWYADNEDAYVFVAEVEVQGV